MDCNGISMFVIQEMLLTTLPQEEGHRTKVYRTMQVACNINPFHWRSGILCIRQNWCKMTRKNAK